MMLIRHNLMFIFGFFQKHGKLDSKARILYTLSRQKYSRQSEIFLGDDMTSKRSKCVVLADLAKDPLRRAACRMEILT